MEKKINSAQEKIIKILEEKMVDPKTMAEKMGRGYTELKVQSMVLTLARKGLINKTKAILFLRGTNMVKFIENDFGAKLRGNVPVCKMR